MDCGCSVAESLKLFLCMYVCVRGEQWGVSGLRKIALQDARSFL